LTRSLPFTEASIRRVITGMRKAGLRVTAVEFRPDGTVLLRSGAETQSGIALEEVPTQSDLPSQQAPEWGDVEA
jgi:hypothetical protein